MVSSTGLNHLISFYKKVQVHFGQNKIQVNSKDDVKLLFYKDENKTPILIKKLEKPDINFEWLLDSETGETKIY